MNYQSQVVKFLLMAMAMMERKEKSKLPNVKK
jgi:hypothetical protein